MIKKIAVISANSPSGRPIVKEAVARGNQVTVFITHDNTTVASDVVMKDPMDITKEDLAGFDAVIDASGAWSDAYLPKHYASLFHICDCLSGTDTKFMIVGGEGTNYDDMAISRWFGNGYVHEHSEYDNTRSILTRWFGSDSVYAGIGESSHVNDFPEAFQERPASMDAVFSELRKRKDVNWVYMSPSCGFSIGGQTVAAYDDYAVDMIDEVESGIHYQQRIGVTCD